MRQQMSVSNKEIAVYAVRMLDNLRGGAGKNQLNNLIYDRFDDGEDHKKRERLMAQTVDVLEALEQLNMIRITDAGYELLNKSGLGTLTEEKLNQVLIQKRIEQTQIKKEDKLEAFKKTLLATLQQMDDRNFEYLIARLMRACGFEFTPGRGVADDGVDGEGYYTVNELLRYKVIVQCKRYGDGHTIGNKYIRDLRGAVSTKAHKGLFVTTSTYTRNARAEAIQHPSIDLLDGNDLVELILKHKIGIEETPDGDYHLSDEYTKKYGFGGNR